MVGPKDRTTRPITDMVKESLFSILSSVIEDAIVADLFCGTGSLGLEALSRGGRHVIFVDMDRDANKRLRQNIAHLEFEEESTVFSADAFRYGIPKLSKIKALESEADNIGCNLAFVDPPFPLSRETGLNSKLGRLLTKISSQIHPGGKVIVRHEKRSSLLESYDRLKITDRRDYGSMAITFLERQ